MRFTGTSIAPRKLRRAHPQRIEILAQASRPGGLGRAWCVLLSMVVDDFHPGRAGAALRPFEADPPLVVTTDAPLPLAAALERFETVAGARQVPESGGRVELVELARGGPRETGDGRDPVFAIVCRPARSSHRRKSASSTTAFATPRSFERRRRSRPTSASSSSASPASPDSTQPNANRFQEARKCGKLCAGSVPSFGSREQSSHEAISIAALAVSG